MAIYQHKETITTTPPKKKENNRLFVPVFAVFLNRERYCRKGDPLHGLRLDSCLTLRNELPEETHMLKKQKTLLGRGARAESSRVREPRRTALPCGLGMGVPLGGPHTSQPRWFQYQGSWEDPISSPCPQILLVRPQGSTTFSIRQLMQAAITVFAKVGGLVSANGPPTQPVHLRNLMFNIQRVVPQSWLF